MKTGDISKDKVQAFNQELINRVRFTRVMGVLAIFIQAGIFVAAHIAIDALNTQYPGSLVWVLWGLIFLVSLGMSFYYPAILFKGTSQDAHEYDKQYGTRYQEWANEVAREAGVNNFRLKIVRDNTPNAFALGVWGRHVALHTGLLSILTEREIKAVIAHEFAHLKAKDSMMMLFTSTMLLSFITIGRALFNLGMYGSMAPREQEDSKKSNKTGIYFMLIGIVLIVFGTLIAPFIGAYVSRLREKVADSFAAALGYGNELNRALEKISQSSQQTRSANAATASLYISPVKNMSRAKHIWSKLMRTHPTNDVRARTIAKINKGDEGLIPDKWEGLIVILITGIVSIAAYYMTGNSGLPQTSYVILTIWLYILYTLLGSGVTPHIELEGRLVYLVLYVMALGYYIIGFIAIHAIGGMPAFTMLIPAMYWGWVLFPIFSMIGEAGFELGSIVADYVAVGYFIITLVAMISMLI